MRALAAGGVASVAAAERGDRPMVALPMAALLVRPWERYWRTPPSPAGTSTSPTTSVGIVVALSALCGALRAAFAAFAAFCGALQRSLRRLHAGALDRASARGGW